jgi:hypothetical protein
MNCPVNSQSDPLLLRRLLTLPAGSINMLVAIKIMTSFKTRLQLLRSTDASLLVLSDIIILQL